MEKISIQTTEKEIIVREGHALPLHEPEKIEFLGVLFAPADFMENRTKQIDPKNCHLIVDEKSGAIEFFIDEKNFFRDIIKGQLRKSSIISLFGINEAKYYGDKELAKFFRKAEYYFVNSDEHKKIVSELMKFKAKVDSVIEKEQDNRGNIKNIYERTVQSNIPESFVMKAPLFDGYPSIEFTVLIGAEADTTGVKFFLESPELFKIEEEEKRKLIRKEVDRFKKFGCAILYK
jgi:hypothetical protein